MSKTSLKLVVRLVVCIGLLAYVATLVDWNELGVTVGSARWGWLIPLFAIMFLNTGICSLKWQLFLRSDGISIPLHKLYATYLVGSFFSMFLPTSMGGDVYRMLHVRRSATASKSVASVMMERLAGFLALSLIAMVAVLFADDVTDVGNLRTVIGLVLILIVGNLLVLNSRRLVSWGAGILRKLRLGKLAKLGEGIHLSVAVYRKRPPLLVVVFLLSCVQQILVIAAIYFLGLALDLGVAFRYYALFVPIIVVVEALPISIFGLGVRDVSYVYLFTRVGPTASECLGLSLLYVTVTVIYASLGGLVYLRRQLVGGAPPVAGPS